jgi:hypothetical protein
MQEAGFESEWAGDGTLGVTRFTVPDLFGLFIKIPIHGWPHNPKPKGR